MITLYNHRLGPNGWKVVILLEALGLKYENKFLDFSKEEQKGPEHTKYNPNGRIPTIIDHDNGDFVLWESNAILKYLVETYDKEYKYHFKPGTKEAFEADQWLFFQASGQGPYFGQATHFRARHELKLPTAIDRYQKEIVRVVSVLDNVLSTRQYLVGSKVSIADFSFIPWNNLIPYCLQDSEHTEEVKKYKHFTRWHEEVSANEGVRKMKAVKEEATKDA